MTSVPASVRALPAAFTANIGTIAGREFRDAVRSRWFVLYTLAFAALGLGVSYLSAMSAGASGLDGFARTTAGLINLVLLVVPLMSLSAGAGSIASDRERGMLAYLLAQPVTRTEVLLGKYTGLAGAMLLCVCLGFGACAGVMAWKGAAVGAREVLTLVGLTFVLAMAMLSVGMLVSVLARRASVATGTAIFVWLSLVFLSDLGIMAGTLALRIRIEKLFAVCAANPVQVFKMWALHSADATLDVLGPAGLYASDVFGRGVTGVFAGAIAVWIVVPLALAAAIFARRSPV